MHSLQDICKLPGCNRVAYTGHDCCGISHGRMYKGLMEQDGMVTSSQMSTAGASETISIQNLSSTHWALHTVSLAFGSRWGCTTVHALSSTTAVLCMLSDSLLRAGWSWSGPPLSCNFSVLLLKKDFAAVMSSSNWSVVCCQSLNTSFVISLDVLHKTLLLHSAACNTMA